MQTRDSLDARRTVFTLAGLALLGLAPALPANAQATPKPTDSVSRKDDAAKQDLARRTDYDLRDDPDYDPLSVDPAPMSYPQAAPGSLHLYHWTDYTRTKMAEGSAQEEREARERLRDERRRKRRERLNSMVGAYSPSTYETDYERNTGYDYTADTPGYPSDSRMQSRMGGTSSVGAAMANWSPMAATGDYVFLVRGDTLYKLNHSDLSIVSQKDLPMVQNSGSSYGSRYSNSNSSSSYNSGSGTAPSNQNGSSSTPGTSASRGTDTGTNSTGTGAGANNGTGNDQNFSNGSTGTSSADSANSNTSGGNSNRRGTNRRFYRQDTTRNSRSSTLDYSRMNGGMMNWAPVSITAGSDYVYVMRGNTLYQMRASDLSLVSQKDLPYMNSAGQNGSRSNYNRSDSSSSQRTDTTGNNTNSNNNTSTNNTNSGGNTNNNPGNSTNKPE